MSRLLTLIGFIVLILSPLGFSYAQNFCQIEQLTDEPEGQSSRASISASGDIITFQSSANINGGNFDGNVEIFFYNRSNGLFAQVTNTSATNISPVVDGLGTKIAFVSNANFNGTNGDFNQEIFLYDILSNSISQITNTTSGGNDRPSINSNGTHIAFESDSNINGTNLDGNIEIYIYHINSDSFTQITNQSSGESIRASINSAGDLVSFQSNADINGVNLGDNFEIYLAQTNPVVLSRITNTDSGASTAPSIDGLGNFIAFHSRANINGGNPDGNQEIYLYNTADNSIAQITNTSMFNSNDADISTLGNVIAFNSSASINGGMDGVNQFYLYNVLDDSFIQVARTTSGLFTNPSTNGNGSISAFQSGFNINGGNPEDNSEIYLAFCSVSSSISQVPTLSEWGLITLAGIFGLVGFIVIRKSLVTT